MRNAAVVAAWELRRTIGRKAFLISTAFVPALLAIAVLVFVIFGDRIGGAVAEAVTSDPDDGYGLIDRAGVAQGIQTCSRSRYLRDTRTNLISVRICMLFTFMYNLLLFYI